MMTRMPRQTQRCVKILRPLGALDSFLRHRFGKRGHNARHHEETTTQGAFGGAASAESELASLIMECRLGVTE
jgi:hypothetical protein